MTQNKHVWNSAAVRVAVKVLRAWDYTATLIEVENQSGGGVGGGAHQIACPRVWFP